MYWSKLSNRAAVLLALIFGSLLIYGGVDDHELLNWDDRGYISNNPWVTNPNLDNTLSLFSEVRMSNWHPLTWLSYIPEYAACGENATCYKMTNAVLHAINSYLVVIFSLLIFGLIGERGWWQEANSQVFRLRRCDWAALFSGGLFLVHPQHVESVTWVAERKDLLCALFYFLALYFYCKAKVADYWRRYTLPLLFFLLAAMSKSMAVTLPAVMIALDIFLLHQERIWVHKDFKYGVKVLFLEKLPFFAVTAGLIILTLISQSAERLQPRSIAEIMAICLSAIQHYVASFFMPWGFSPFYPEEIVSTDLFSYWSTFVLIVLMVFLLARKGIASNKMLVLLFFAFFLITISPVVGIVKVGEQAFADRYSYIPMLGFYLLVGWAFAQMLSRYQRFAMPIAIVSIVSLGGQTYAYKQTWKNDLEFWSTVVAQFPEAAATPINNLANSYATIGDYEQAIGLYQLAIVVDGASLDAYINLAIVYEFLGEREIAIQILAEGADRNPLSAGLQSRAGRAYLSAGDIDAARYYINRAVELQADLPDVLLSQGMLLLSQGDIRASISAFESVPPGMPQHFQANLLLAQALGKVDIEEALMQLDKLRNVYGDRQEISALREQLTQ